jgi:hypothetical protein
VFLRDLVSECVLCLSATLDVMPAVYSSTALSSSSSSATTSTSTANSNSSSSGGAGSSAAANSSGNSSSNSSGRSGSKSSVSSSSSASSSRMVLFPAPKAKRTLAAAIVPLMDLLLSTENEVQRPLFAVVVTF